MTTPRETTTEQPDELSIDPYVVIESILADDKIPSEARAEIKKTHDMFDRVGCNFADNAPFAEALWLAYTYGTIIGAYVATGDPAMLKKIGSLQQSVKGRRPRPRAWREPAKELAVTLRQGNPKLSQEALAEKIHEKLPASLKCPGVDTLIDFISELERAGTLPGMKR
jgi:hypothetical protein